MRLAATALTRRPGNQEVSFIDKLIPAIACEDFTDQIRNVWRNDSVARDHKG